MSLGLSIAGTYAARGKQSRPPAPAAWLNELAQWVEGAFGDLLETEPEVFSEADPPLLLLNMHPCAEPIEVRAPGRGELRLTAMTSSVGPGYHQFVCELMDAMTEQLGVRWGPEAEGESEDETGYFYRRDRAALERSMLEWLQALCRAFTGPGGMVGPDASPHPTMKPMMAMGIGTTFIHDGDVTTPMGPRNRPWFEAAAADPRRGTDFFAWWHEGNGAHAKLGRALALMWAQVRWARAASEHDYNVQLEAAGLLAEVFSEDSSLPYPWREWAELMGLLEWDGEPREEVEARAAKVDRSIPLIGYRRRDVIVTLPGGWMMQLPGGLSAEFEEESGEYIASDGDRTVRFSSMAVGGGDRPPTMEDLSEEPLQEIGAEDEVVLEPWMQGRLAARGRLGRVEDDGRTCWMLASMIVTDGGFAIVTIFFDHERDREWAMRTWRSISYAGAPDSWESEE